MKIFREDLGIMSEKDQLAAVKQDGWSIEYIKEPSEAVQLAAVKQNGLAIKYIKKPSEAVELAAVHNMYKVFIIGENITIGCQTRTKEEWLKLSDEELVKLGGKYMPLFKSELLKEL